MAGADSILVGDHRHVLHSDMLALDAGRRLPDQCARDILSRDNREATKQFVGETRKTNIKEDQKLLHNIARDAFG